MYQFSIFFSMHLLLSLYCSGQVPNMLLQKWQLASIYLIDSTQKLYDKSELSNAEHQRIYEFNLRELKLEQRLLIFNTQKKVFSLELSVNYTQYLKELGNFEYENNEISLDNGHTKWKILALSPNILILGKNKSRIEVYTSIPQTLEDLRLPDDFIWQYYKAYFPNELQRTDND